jgi:hypothetical protein
MRRILSLRLLPPFAIGRLGSGGLPVDNYTLAPTDPDSPLDYRKLRRRQVLDLAPDAQGDMIVVEVKTDVDAPLQFKDKGADVQKAIEEARNKGDKRPAEDIVNALPDRFRPVAPFIEAFAEVEGENELQPLTEALLIENGLTLDDVAWNVRVANRKVARRTGNEDDAVIAVETGVKTHGWVELKGRCRNFRDAEPNHISFGRVCYPKPQAPFSGLRLRFHPAQGLIYGPPAPDEAPDPIDPHQKPYVIPQTQQVYDPTKAGATWKGMDVRDKKTWKGLDIGEGKRFFNETVPPALFAIDPPAPNWLYDNVAVSRGYFDDACDGFVELRVGNLKPALARVCAAPPATAPDARFLRTLADDLDQAILGPDVGDEETPQETRARALDIVRRAFETVSFMNVAVMNGNNVNGRPALILDSMPEEEAADTERMIRPVMAPTSVDTFAIKLLHQQAYAAIRGGAAPWFARLLRRPDEAADYTDFGRRKMPALMCGADNNYLALTWRQIATIEKTAAAGPLQTALGEIALEADAAEALKLPAPPLAGPKKLKPRNLTAQIRYAAAGNPVSTLPVTSVANCCPGLEVDFRAIWRRLFVGIELREYDNLVVRLWPDPKGAGPDGGDFEPAESFVDVRSDTPKPKEGDGEPEYYGLRDLPGRRLLRVFVPVVEDKPGANNVATAKKEPREIHVIGVMKGPATSDLEAKIDLTTASNPNGVAPLEWSNALAHVMDYARRSETPVKVRCDFGPPDAWDKPSAPIGAGHNHYISFHLEVRRFFEDDTAVISRALARAGELTQGLCSPWQNDYRECSCYYWASARPDFVNVEVDGSGLSAGDNWMSRERTGHYIADDYKDSRLMMYDELFYGWEDKLKVIVQGRDYKPKTP